MSSKKDTQRIYSDENVAKIFALTYEMLRRSGDFSRDSMGRYFTKLETLSPDRLLGKLEKRERHYSNALFARDPLPRTSKGDMLPRTVAEKVDVRQGIENESRVRTAYNKYHDRSSHELLSEINAEVRKEDPDPIKIFAIAGAVQINCLREGDSVSRQVTCNLVKGHADQLLDPRSVASNEIYFRDLSPGQIKFIGGCIADCLSLDLRWRNSGHSEPSQNDQLQEDPQKKGAVLYSESQMQRGALQSVAQR